MGLWHKLLNLSAGGAGGLETRAQIAEQRQWDGQAVKKSDTPPYHQHCQTDYQLIY